MKTSLKKRTRAASIFFALISSCLIDQMLTIFSGVEFQKTEEKFRKRKRKWRCLEFPSSKRREIRLFGRQRTYTTAWFTCRTYCFFCLSRWRCRRRCLSSLLSRHRESAKKNEQKSFSRSWWVCETFLLRHCSGESRPSDKRGGGVGVILTLRKEGAGLKKKIFRPSGLSLVQK